MKYYRDFLKEQLKDPEFKKEYDALESEFQVKLALIDLRNELNLTQEELAEKTGINQSEISKLENGTRNPSIKLLQRIADSVGMNVSIKFIPKPNL